MNLLVHVMDINSSIFHLRNVVYVTSFDYHEANRFVASKIKAS